MRSLFSWTNAMLLSGGPLSAALSGKPPPKRYWTMPGKAIGDLCRTAFQSAGRFDSNAALRYVPSPEIQQATGLSIEPGKSIHHYLLFASSARLAKDRHDILSLSSQFLPFADRSRWRRQCVALADVFLQFFGHAAVRDLPGFVWFLPVWVSNYYRFRLANGELRDEGNPPERLPFQNDLQVDLSFGRGSNEPPVSLPLSLKKPTLHWAFPKELGRKPSVYRLRRTRKGVVDGQPLLPAIERNVGLGTPEVEPLIQRGYFPAYADRVVRDAAGRSQFIRFYSVILARLLPRCTLEEANVHQLYLSFDLHSGEMTDATAINMDFDQLLLIHPGIADQLAESLGKTCLV